MNTGTRSADEYQACAGLYQLLSVAWSYPDALLFEALDSGEFGRALSQSLDGVAHDDRLRQAGDALLAGASEFIDSHQPVELESDYIALFENSLDAPVTHLYQHLYVDDERSQVDILKTMNRRYQRLGIELKQGDGVEQADHLTVQLECLAWCYAQLAASTNADEHEATDFYADEIRQLLVELGWVDRLAAQLHSNCSHHPFYLPLVDFSAALLAGRR